MESEGPKHIPRDNVFCETDCPRCAYDHKEFMKSEEARMESEGPHTHGHSVYTRCLECQIWGINLPGETRCGNCSAEGCVLYVPDCCVRAAHAEGIKSEREQCVKILRDYDERIGGILLRDCLDTLIELLRGGQDAK